MARRKGIVLAGGTGSRLFPLTYAVSKQLLPIYDKPMIYYPIGTLMEVGIEEIAVITTPEQRPAFTDLLGDGSRFGVSIEFIEQPRPEGLAQAYILAERFLAGASSIMVLGDNIFSGPSFLAQLARANARLGRCTVFGLPVSDPANYGVVSFDNCGRALMVEEKPRFPRSNVAVTGLYVLDADAPRRAREVRPSPRGELEITDILQSYLKDRLLDVEQLGPGCTWFDTGNPDNLLEAGQFVRSQVTQGGSRLGALEEIAFHQGFTDTAAVLSAAARQANTAYGKRLRRLALAGRIPAPALAHGA